METAPAATLTGRQLERRQRILDTALELAAAGGYDAVQMRDVAADAGVALGTLYRYFESKDQLLAAAWVEWASRLEQRVLTRPVSGATLAEKASDFLSRATRPLEREPKLASALVLSLSTTDPGAAPYRHDVETLVSRLLGDVLREEGLDPEVADGCIEVLDQVWYSALLAWVSGRRAIADVYLSLERAAHLLLDPRDPRAGGATA